MEENVFVQCVYQNPTNTSLHDSDDSFAKINHMVCYGLYIKKRNPNINIMRRVMKYKPTRSNYGKLQCNILEKVLKVSTVIEKTSELRSSGPNDFKAHIVLALVCVFSL